MGPSNPNPPNESAHSNLTDDSLGRKTPKPVGADRCPLHQEGGTLTIVKEICSSEARSNKKSMGKRKMVGFLGEHVENSFFFGGAPIFETNRQMAINMINTCWKLQQLSLQIRFESLGSGV